MGEWKNCTLSDLGTVVGGATPSTKRSENYSGGTIAWITPKDLAGFSGRFISKGERNITEVGLKSCSTQLMPAHTVLFSSRAPIGYVAIAKQEVCTNQGFKSVVPNEKTDFMFLYYLLKYNKDRIEHLGSGTTFKEVSGNTMRNVEVRVPIALEEQKQIASVLSALDDKIEENAEVNENLEEQAQAIFKAWFIDLIPFNRVMPSDWTTTKLGDICVCELGGTPSRNKQEYWNGDIPWVNSGEVNQFRIIKPSEYITPLGLSKSATKLLPSKTTVLAITGATLGQVSLLEISSCANQSVVGVLPNEILPYEFIYPFIKTNINKLLSHQTGGAQQHINKQNVEALNIVLPSPDVIDKYTSVVSPLYSTIANNCFTNERLSEIRDILLPQLMSGELDVSGIDR